MSSKVPIRVAIQSGIDKVARRQVIHSPSQHEINQNLLSIIKFLIKPIMPLLWKPKPILI